MKAFFGAMFGAAMLLAPASGAFAAGGYLQASSEEDQIVKEANKPQMVTMASTDAAKGIKNNKGMVQLDQTGTFSTDVNGTSVTIIREDVTISAQSIEGWLVDSGDGLTVALDTTLTPELINEGLAREFVNRVQNMRKDAGLEVTDRIRINFEAPSRVAEAVQRLSDYIKSETLATQVTSGRDSAEHWEKWDIDGEPCEIGISKA